MILIVYSTADIASLNAANSIIDAHNLREGKPGAYEDGEIRLMRTDVRLLHAESVDEAGAELVIFLSRHSSSSGIPAITVHPLGNWGIEARLGGKPKTLSVAAPTAMLSILRSFSASALPIEKTYEATHHGPLLNTPSLFAEFGGSESTINDKAIAAQLGEMVYGTATALVDSEPEFSKVALGIGSNHYPSKFTKLALDKGYAFSHIMPKHAMTNADGSDNIDMLEQAALRSSDKIDCAVIDWKSLNSGMRSSIIKRLDSIGISYERV